MLAHLDHRKARTPNSASKEYRPTNVKVSTNVDLKQPMIEIGQECKSEGGKDR